MNTTKSAAVPTSAPNLWISGLTGGAAALAAVLILFAIARLAGVSLMIGMPPDMSTPVPLPATQMVVATLVPAIAATLIYAGLRSILKGRADRVFQGLAVVVFLVSLGGPLSLPVTLANKVFLALMHAAAAGAIVWALTRRSKEG